MYELRVHRLWQPQRRNKMLTTSTTCTVPTNIHLFIQTFPQHIVLCFDSSSLLCDVFFSLRCVGRLYFVKLITDIYVFIYAQQLPTLSIHHLVTSMHILFVVYFHCCLLFHVLFLSLSLSTRDLVFFRIQDAAVLHGSFFKAFLLGNQMETAKYVLSLIQCNGIVNIKNLILLKFFELITEL